MSSTCKKLLLSPAYLVCLGAYQIAACLLFVDLRLALIPLVAFLLISFVAPFVPWFSYYLPVISHGERSENKISLTFDDGPDPFLTLSLLDLLDEKNISATFFVVGKKVEENPGIIKEIIKRGHLIGNHSLDHSNTLMLKSREKLYNNIKAAQDILFALGVRSFVFRPPVGITNPRLWDPLFRLGLHCVNFSCRAFDRGNKKITGLAGRIVRKSKGGDVVLLHDSRPAGSFDRELWLLEIEDIIDGIGKKNLEIVPLDELIKIPVMELASCRGEADPVGCFYDSLADEYDYEQMNTGVSRARIKERERVFPVLQTILKPAMQVLEIGAGTGFYTLDAAGLVENVTAVDISKGMLSVLERKTEEKNLKNITTWQGDFLQYNENREFDIIVSFSVFEYFDDMEGLIEKAGQYLKPGGIFYFTTAHSSLPRFFVQIGNAMRQGVWLKGRSRSRVERIFKDRGFSIKMRDTFLYKFSPWGGMILEMIAEKK